MSATCCRQADRLRTDSACCWLLQDTPLSDRSRQPRGKVCSRTCALQQPTVQPKLRERSLNRDFVMSTYQELKKANPRLPILIRECEGVTPKLIARYGMPLVLPDAQDAVDVDTTGP